MRPVHRSTDADDVDQQTATSSIPADWSTLRAPSALCGVGFGGFFDGIVFHQIFRLHHMVSNAGNDRLGLDPAPTGTIAGLETNILWDGLFHAATYLALLSGVFWLWRRWQQQPPTRPPTRLLIGGLLTGWGLFNVVEGIINHHILALHHVVEGDDAIWFDLAFLAVGTAQILAGIAVTRQATEKTVA